MIYVILYLSAIVAANLLVAQFGIPATIPVAFLLIGADLVVRDALHEKWQTNKYLKMGALIASGSVISYLLNRDAGMIAIASFCAFALSATADTLVYSLLEKSTWLKKSNASNLVGALVDSLVFPTIAFGGLLLPVVIGQFLAKTLGGALWSIVILWARRPEMQPEEHDPSIS